ncbi:MAG: PmeII family type II restriction endonuclease [Candidatus Nitricoxidivorans perseverans]|uniref:PmeII family type II restriction endonuclease n=1 Tax=Candidatus Nitricoxidivorans perseverans TaxID=2975601 RepID=A0AA49FJA2_9PROT|nr:MAG: PmeII family type II restriction endonuclease [Candidatus Nitricoxidivorans perseverans]
MVEFIEKNIPSFHQKRLESLAGLKLEKVLGRKNPYLFKAKHIETAGELVKQLLDAHLSSQEETVFGDFLETLAIHVCQKTYAGRKSATEGIDLEFDRDGVRYLVSIKSGPNWGNASQVKKMREYFRQARKIVGNKQHLIAVNGCCYGRDSKPEKGDYQKLCGQSFWELISGNDRMYQEIVEPLGHRAKERNEVFHKEYAKVANRFAAEFIRDFCAEDGAIDWGKIVAFNSATIKPPKKLAISEK